jgi:hypothetical protein
MSSGGQRGHYQQQQQRLSNNMATSTNNPFDLIEALPPQQPIHHGRQASLPTASNHVHFQTNSSLHPPDFHSRRPEANGRVQHRMSDHSSDMDLSMCGERLPPILHHGGHAGGHHRPQHELKRPDSVITTSSIVSSDTASQAGDSSNETTNHGPPSVYAQSGLYGVLPTEAKEAENKNILLVNRRRTYSGSLGRTEAVTDSNPIPTSVASNVVTAYGSGFGDHAILAKSNSCAASSSPVTSSSSSAIHKRQTSHPASMPPPASSASAVTSSELHSSSKMENAAFRHGSTQIKGHRRSHSYGHHKGMPSSDGNYGPRHRRTGSSVIETLQTLACSGTEQENRNESIAQFLDNLRKEQQEK